MSDVQFRTYPLRQGDVIHLKPNEEVVDVQYIRSIWLFRPSWTYVTVMSPFGGMK